MRLYRRPMRADAPGPGEELNPGEESAAREAASTIVLRDHPRGPEVLLVQRNPSARFMGGAWVFPGGAVHDEDDGPVDAALRELREEAGISLDGPEVLVPFSRWITPAQVKIRFDTWFFAAAAPDGAEAVVDGEECVDARWLRPTEALAAHAHEELMLVFPTIRHLEGLIRYGSVADALDDARGREIVAVQPRVVAAGDDYRVLMPGDPGFDD